MRVLLGAFNLMTDSAVGGARPDKSVLSLSSVCPPKEMPCRWRKNKATNDGRIRGLVAAKPGLGSTTRFVGSSQVGAATVGLSLCPAVGSLRSTAGPVRATFGRGVNRLSKFAGCGGLCQIWRIRPKMGQLPLAASSDVFCPSLWCR